MISPNALARYLALLFIVGCATNSSGQRNKRSPGFEWPPLSETSVKTKFAAHDAVILTDNNRLIVTGAKEEFINLRFIRHFKVKLLTEQGVQAFSKISLPESYDPVYDYRDVPVLKRDEIVRPQYFEVKPVEFQARVVRKNGKSRPAEYVRKMLTESKLFNLLMTRSEAYSYTFTQLKVGDELEIFYKYEIPFDKNWYNFNAARIFFQGKVPKQSYSLEISHYVRNESEFSGAAPNSDQEVENKRVLRWERTDVSEVLQEIGARPANDLEHVVFGLNRNSFRYHVLEPLSKMRGTTPYWSYFLRQRESRAMWWRRVAMKNLPDRQNTKLNAFVDRCSVGVPDSLPHNQALAAHAKIVKDFEFKPDLAYFQGTDQRLERIGDHAADGQIREISRYNLYSKIYNRLRVPYLTVYMTDKRIGTPTRDYVGPIYDQDFAFVFGGNVNRLLFMYPKRHRFGYEADELPFYWEGTKALLSNVDLLHTFGYDSVLLVNTHLTEAKANYRKTTVQAHVDYKAGTVTFDSKLHVRGQFSTMTRGFYLYEYRDSSINPKYHEHLYDLPKHNVTVTDREMSSHSISYPYAANFRLKYNARKLCVQDPSTGIWVVPIRSWFNLIYHEDFSARNRSQPYYSDFLYQDEFRYFLTFDDPVELVNEEQLEQSIDNLFGTLKLEIERVNSTTYRMQLMHVVSNAKVPADKVAQVQEVFNAIDHLNQQSLQFVVQHGEDQ